MGRLWSSESDGGQRAWLDPRNLFPEPKSCANRDHDTPMPEPLGDQLKGLFDNGAQGPMPKRLIDLADALEDAFQRGELHRKAQP